MTILVLIGKVYLWCCYCYSYESFFPFLPTELSFESKVKFRQASNHCKMVLKVAKHAYANKRNSITSQKLGFWDFWRINNSVLNKGKSVVPLLFTGPEVLSSASDKAKLFSKNDDLMTQVSLYLFSRLGLIWNCIMFLYFPRWLKSHNKPWFAKGV